LKFEFPKLYTELAKYYDSLESQYRNYGEEAIWLHSILNNGRISNVIDISCGSASHLHAIGAHAPKYDLYAMDASKEMVQVARSKLTSEKVDLMRSDFLNMPIRDGSFDAAICMYWSIAGLDEELAKTLFSRVSSILRPGGLFIFDTENSEGIREELLGVPFIDALIEQQGSAIVRANFSTRKESDLVDWRAFYLVETSGHSALIEDQMNLRFYSKEQIQRLLKETGFRLKEVLSSGLREYYAISPTLYFIAEKI
jgi:ubiquinone/menaquinone biosynthesis C-methylase UbiE